MRKVALVILDCVRKDHFDQVAHRLKGMADLDVDKCYAASTWSVPSHASIFTGLLPHEHGVHSYNTDYSQLDPFFDEVNSEGISANSAVSDTFNSDEIFDEFVSYSGIQEMTPDAVTYKGVDKYEGVTRIFQYLKKSVEEGKVVKSLVNGASIKLNNYLKQKPLHRVGDHGANEVTSRLKKSTEDFIFCNYIDCHGPMENHRYLKSEVPKQWHSNRIPIQEIRNTDVEPDSDDVEKYINLYDSSLDYLDRKLSQFAKEMPDDMTLIITADHGEELFDGESGSLGHMSFSQMLLHVPFLIINADIEYDGGMVSHLDIPRIVDQLWDSRSVTVPTREVIPSERPGMMFYDGDDPWWTRAVRAVTVDGTRWQWDDMGNTNKIELANSKELKKEEHKIPAEYKNLFGGTVEELGDNNQHLEVGEDAENRLEELGYKV